MACISSITDDQSISLLTAANESLLVAATQRGDHLAYAELCRRHHEMVFRIVLRITGNTADAEDVLQDSWMKAFIHINTFDGRSTFSTWLTRIAINSALAILRKRKKQEFSLDNSDESDNHRPMELVELSRNPEECCLEAERKTLIRKAIRRLPSKLRMALEMRESQEGSVQEIAMMAGVPVATMKSRLLRARRRLHEPLRRALQGGTAIKVANNMRAAGLTRMPLNQKTFEKGEGEGALHHLPEGNRIVEFGTRQQTRGFQETNKC
jgi:RNA polymerase sigma factor (sigma-70 family)